MYQIKCIYPDAVIDTLGERKTAEQAKQLITAFQKQNHIHWRHGKPIEYWYQKENADTPDYIRFYATERLLNQN